MELELDHIFVCTAEPERDTRLLEAAGLVCGANRIHAGQGSANAVYCFDNAYLELLWMEDEHDLLSPSVAPLRLWERIHWCETGACPFGIALRPSKADAAEPSAAWTYAPPYSPPGMAVPMISVKGSTEEPLVFVMRTGGAPSRYPAERAAPLEHRGRRRMLRHVSVAMRAREVSAGLREVCRSGLLSFVYGAESQMQLQFAAGEAIRETMEFRPELPLSIEW